MTSIMSLILSGALFFAPIHENIKSIPISHYIQNRTQYEEMIIPKADTSWKVYMDYRFITDKSSTQWKMQQFAYTDELGFRRLYDDYIVAMGTYYSEECGTRLRIHLENERIFTVIVGDIKQPRHTDKDNMYHPVKNRHGELVYANVLEFIIDTNVMSDKVLNLGDVSSLGFEGQIIKIERIN